jgi:hypothetical protein
MKTNPTANNILTPQEFTTDARVYVSVHHEFMHEAVFPINNIERGVRCEKSCWYGRDIGYYIGFDICDTKRCTILSIA